MIGSIYCMYCECRNCPIVVARSNNNINVLNQSLLFTDVFKGEALNVNFTINGHEYGQGYYLLMASTLGGRCLWRSFSHIYSKVANVCCMSGVHAEGHREGISGPKGSILYSRYPRSFFFSPSTQCDHACCRCFEQAPTSKFMYARFRPRWCA